MIIWTEFSVFLKNQIKIFLEMIGKLRHHINVISEVESTSSDSDDEEAIQGVGNSGKSYNSNIVAHFIKVNIFAAKFH